MDSEELEMKPEVEDLLRKNKATPNLVQEWRNAQFHAIHVNRVRVVDVIKGTPDVDVAADEMEVGAADGRQRHLHQGVVGFFQARFGDVVDTDPARPGVDDGFHQDCDDQTPAIRPVRKRHFLPPHGGIIEYVCDSQAGICTTWPETAAGHAVAAWEGDGATGL